MKLKILALGVASVVALTGCAEDYGYGGVEVGYGAPGYYDGGYYGEGYGDYSGFYGDPYFGWYGGYYQLKRFTNCEWHVGLTKDLLRHIREDHIHHAHEHAIAERVAGVFDNGDDVRAVCGHGDQVSSAAVRELHGVDAASGADNVGDVRD